MFCEECRRDVAYNIEKIKMEHTLKGYQYLFTGKVATCANCRSEIYVDDVNDYNLKALYNRYRMEHDIVSQDIILKIPQIYAIGKRPLSLLLGWGEQTYSRYCEGDLPTKQYSAIIQKIYDDPYYYEELLEKNKGKLQSFTTYEKSRRAINNMFEKKAVNKLPIDLSIEYLLNQCEDITPLALQKALYYIQGFYFAFYKKFFFAEDCEAWVHGPVFRDIYVRYRNYRFDPIKSNNEFDSSVFTVNEKAILDSVIKNICCYSGKILERFTHSEGPWLSARGELTTEAISNRTIQKNAIGDYFTTIKEMHKMKNPNDINIYTKIMFEQV